MKESDKEMYLLHAQMPGFRRKVKQSIEIIQEFLRISRNPYIAWSTGKDSTCCVGLVRQVANVPAVHLDNGVELPGTAETREKMDNVIHHIAEVPFLDLMEQYGFEARELRKENFVRAFEQKYDFDGVILGLRAEESRARILNAKNGPIYKKKDGIYVCCPILYWSVRDVFAYLLSNELPIHPHYLLDSAQPLEERRVGGFISSRNRGAEMGRFVWLRQQYPNVFQMLAERFPEIKKYV